MDGPNKKDDDRTLWHFQEQDESVGPIDAAELEMAIGDGRINRDTMVWHDGMDDWVPARQTKLRSMLAPGLPPPVSAARPRRLSPPAVSRAARIDDAETLQTWFTTYWICLAVGIPLSFVIVGLAGVIAATVFYCLILHKLWSLIPPSAARTTPGKAVGFQFIPLFNFYWIFVAYHGLAQDLNAETRRHAIHDRQISEGLCLTYCILSVCSVIPYVGFVTVIPAVVIGIVTLKQIKDAGVALVHARAA